MDTKITADLLARCIIRAEKISSGGIWNSHFDWYWYTRGKCLEIARANSIKWPSVLSLCKYYERNGLLDSYMQVTEVLWTEVAHPDIIISEVMKT